MAAVLLRPISISGRSALRSCSISPKLLPNGLGQSFNGRSQFSTSAFRRVTPPPHSEADAKNKQRYKEEDVNVQKTAQTLVNDRPWHRQNSHSLPEATSSDPTGRDESKGKPPPNPSLTFGLGTSANCQ
jgi:hypothetical protein